MLVSLSLSRAGIAHTLIGGPRPPESPRLGESMNEGSALALWDLLGPQYREFYHLKSHISISCRELAGLVVVADSNRTRDSIDTVDPAKATFGDVGPRIVHIDRARLDPALYDDVRAQPHCNFIEAHIDGVDHDTATDRVTAVRYGGDQSLEPSTVFDATGYRGVVPTAAQLHHRHLSRLQRVVWLHRYRDDDMPDHPWWRHGTNVVRLERMFDGIDGIAWMIPLGREVSLGISVDAENHGPDVVSEAMLADALVRAYNRRGMSVSRNFPRAGAVRTITHRYFVRGRAHGANWMLAGSTFGQVWFPTSTGVSTSTMAAYLAPRFIERPAEIGAEYEAQFEALMPFHELLEGLIEKPPPVHMHQMYRFCGAWIRGVLERTPDYLRLYGDRPTTPMAAARLLTRTIRGSGLSWLAGAFLTMRVQRVGDASDWSGLFPHYRRHGRFLAGNVLTGFGRYLASVAAQLWRGSPASAALPPGKEETVRSR